MNNCKKCTGGCNLTLEVNETNFYKRSSGSKDGFRDDCKKCILKKAKIRYNPEFKKIYNKNYFSKIDVLEKQKLLRDKEEAKERKRITDYNRRGKIRETLGAKSYESTGEAKIRNVLEKVNINFIKEKSFDRRYSFDFYLPDYNLCVEYDGEQHYKPFGFDKTKEIFEKIRRGDLYKNKFCEDNNINLLRIPYWDFDKIESLLTQTIFKDN